MTDTSDLASSRWAVLRTIERLDPERDHQRIVHLSFGYEFPWDSIRALEIALYRTYCVPSISALLDRTGEFHHEHPAPLRRHVDPRRRDVRVGLRERARQGSARADELGARALQDRQRRLPLRAVDVHLRAGALDRRGSAGGRRAPTSGSATTVSGAKSASGWASSTFRRRTTRSRPGAASTNGSTSGSPTSNQRVGTVDPRPVRRRGSRGS